MRSELGDVLAHVLHVVADDRVFGVAEAAQVWRDDLEMRRQQRNDVTPVIMCLRHAVQQEQRFALSGGDIVQADAVDPGAAVFDGLALVIDDGCRHWFLSLSPAG